VKQKTIRFFFISLLVFAPEPARSQTPEQFRLIEIIQVKTDFFTADHLGNLFFLTNDGLIKHQTGAKTQKHYSNPQYGKISWVDASDPFNILLLHQGFQQIFWLDRNLAIKEGPALPQAFISDFPTQVCHSSFGGFWAYFPVQNQLKRFNQSFHLQALSPPFFEILERFNEPVFLIEAGGLLYVSDQQKGIAVFDAFGNFLFLIEKKGIARFQVLGNLLVYFSDKEMVLFDIVLQKETLFLLPEKEFISGLLRGRRLYLQTENEIRLYEFNERRLF